MKIITFFFIHFILITGAVFAASTSVNDSPETLVFELSKVDSRKWKEITHQQNVAEKIYEYIPFDQKEGNWSELISVQYFDKFSVNRKAICSVEGFIESYGQQLAKTYPANILTYKIIKKNESDVIYEWILHKTYLNIRPQHEVARAFLTKRGFHRIGVTYQDREMSVAERDKWIKFLKDNVSIKPEIEKVAKSVDHVPIELGPEFEGWKLIRYPLGDVHFMEIRVPPWLQNGDYINECLEVSFHLNAQIPIDEAFKIGKNAIEERSSGCKGDFNIVKKSLNEIVYHYTCPFPKDKLLITGVCRSIVTKKGYFYIHYKRGLPFQPPKEEMIEWQRRLEKIQIQEKP